MPRPSHGTGRMVAILNFLAENPREFFSLSEIARQLNLNKATAHGVLNGLAEAGYVFRHPVDKSFSLGPALVGLGQAAVAPDSKIIAFAYPEMVTLAEAIGVECLAGVKVGDEIVCAATAGTPVMPNISELGYRTRLFPPHGIVFVAWASEDVIEAYLDNITTPKERAHYRSLLETVRERGYSLAARGQARARLDRALRAVQDEEITSPVQKTLATLAAELAGDEYQLLNINPRKEYQLQGISAPVFDANDRVRLGLTLRGLPKITGAQIRQHAKELVAAADQVSRLIGGTGRPASNRTQDRSSLR
jgi:DNA-binding IclR family transcriptional regulator